MPSSDFNDAMRTLDRIEAAQAERYRQATTPAQPTPQAATDDEAFLAQIKDKTSSQWFSSGPVI